RQLAAISMATNRPELATWVEANLKKAPALKESEVFVYKKEEFDKDMIIFAKEIEQAQLDEEVKVRMRAVHTVMVSLTYQKGDVNNMVAKVANSYAFPLRKVVAPSVKGLQKKKNTTLAGLTEGDKIIARMTYEARSAKIDDSPGGRESGWKRFFQKLNYHLFTAESWISRDTHRPGKLVRLWRWAFAEEFDNLT